MDKGARGGVGGCYLVRDAQSVQANGHLKIVQVGGSEDRETDRHKSCGGSGIHQTEEEVRC